MLLTFGEVQMHRLLYVRLDPLNCVPIVGYRVSHLLSTGRYTEWSPVFVRAGLALLTARASPSLAYGQVLSARAGMPLKLLR